MTKQKRHASNIIYRDVADEYGFEALRAVQESLTGKKVSLATVRRYYNGYGEFQAIPTPGFQAARNLTSASFMVVRALNKTKTK